MRVASQGKKTTACKDTFGGRQLTKGSLTRDVEESAVRLTSTADAPSSGAARTLFVLMMLDDVLAVLRPEGFHPFYLPRLERPSGLQLFREHMQCLVKHLHVPFERLVHQVPSCDRMPAGVLQGTDSSGIGDSEESATGREIQL